MTTIDWKAPAGRGFIERDHEQVILSLALLTGEHVCLFGDPGVAKSALANGLVKALGGKYFSLLMTRFTTTEEVFGPLSLKALEEDRFERQTDGYLPDASVAFLDEVFKANSAILNTLLAVLNERVYFEKGVARKVPLEICIGASNEFPDPDSGLGALYDRFLFRRWVSPIRDTAKFAQYFLGAEIQDPTPIDPGELAAARRSVAMVLVKPQAAQWIVTLKNQLAAKNIRVSDRRWLKCRKVMQAHAFLRGATEVAPSDLAALSPVLWSDVKDIPEIEKIIAQCIQTANVPVNPNLNQFAQTAAGIASGKNPAIDHYRPKKAVTDPQMIALAKSQPGQAEHFIAHANERIAIIQADNSVSDQDKAILVAEWQTLISQFLA